ncbi:alpha/beta hydrolase [Streptomyces sp. DSM 41029]
MIAMGSTARSLASRAGAAARRPYWQRPSPAYLVRRWPDLTATCVATVFFWLSQTPSLVPRPWYLQGLIGGLNAAIGYALGVTVSWLFRLLVGRRPRPAVRAHAWQAYFLLSPVCAVWLISESAHMQRQLRALQGLPPSLTWHTPMIALITVALWALLLLLARAVRLGASRLIRLLGRLLPRPAAVGLGLLLSSLAVLFCVQDLVFERGVVDIADRISKATDGGTKEGVTPPASRLVSGGPGSYIRWRDLGFQGRNFAGSVLTSEQISDWTGRDAVDPVRVYAGSAAPEAFAYDEDPVAAQVDLAMKELERTGAFDRDVLAIAGTTGTGWVNANVVEPLEYMHDGNTATVALQYSYLPSWLSFLVDKEKAAHATRELVEAVRARWAALPPDERPRLVVTGESLGAYAVEASYERPGELLDNVDGALLLGPPNFSPLSEEIRARRDPASPVWRPLYEEGRNFRFAQFPRRDLARPDAPWEGPRVVYLQNASDPVVWWSHDLLLKRPEWLDDPLGPDITPEINWFPFVTFWQTSVDMAVSYGVQAPHGHRYGAGPVDGWAAVAPREGWTDADTRRLHDFIAARDTPY